MGEVAWYDGNSDMHAHPVGHKVANAWGIYDMSGNVGEWTWDWLDNYPTGRSTDPQGPPTGDYRVDRGGSFYKAAISVRAAHRDGVDPRVSSVDLGFRVVLPE